METKAPTRPKRMRDCERKLLLLDTLRARHDHPDAATCARDLGRLVPGIGQSTVYRHLASLVEQGLITEIANPDGPARYDGTTETHAHLQCIRCSALLDAPEVRVVGQWPGRLQTLTVVAKGVCHACQNNPRQKTRPDD